MAVARDELAYCIVPLRGAMQMEGVYTLARVQHASFEVPRHLEPPDDDVLCPEVVLRVVTVL